jgi:hypothetical protein
MSVAEKEAAVPRNPLREVYFSELHLHTAYSLDAYIFGNTLSDPFMAYRFARGAYIRSLPRRTTADGQGTGWDYDRINADTGHSLSAIRGFQPSNPWGSLRPGTN